MFCLTIDLNRELTTEVHLFWLVVSLTNKALLLLLLLLLKLMLLLLLFHLTSQQSIFTTESTGARVSKNTPKAIFFSCLKTQPAKMAKKDKKRFHKSFEPPTLFHLRF